MAKKDLSGLSDAIKKRGGPETAIQAGLVNAAAAAAAKPARAPRKPRTSKLFAGTSAGAAEVVGPIVGPTAVTPPGATSDEMFTPADGKMPSYLPGTRKDPVRRLVIPARDGETLAFGGLEGWLRLANGGTDTWVNRVNEPQVPATGSHEELLKAAGFPPTTDSATARTSNRGGTSLRDVLPTPAVLDPDDAARGTEGHSSGIRIPPVPPVPPVAPPGTAVVAVAPVPPEPPPAAAPASRPRRPDRVRPPIPPPVEPREPLVRSAPPPASFINQRMVLGIGAILLMLLLGVFSAYVLFPNTQHEVVSAPSASPPMPTTVATPGPTVISPASLPAPASPVTTTATGTGDGMGLSDGDIRQLRQAAIDLWKK